MLTFAELQKTSATHLCASLAEPVSADIMPLFPGGYNYKPIFFNALDASRACLKVKCKTIDKRRME